MNKIKEALWNDYDGLNGVIGELKIESPEAKVALEERDKLRKELIELEKIELENKTKMSQIRSESERDKVRNIITIGTFTISTGVSVYAIIKTFKFDQVATVTSTLGRNILNGVIPKVFKR